MIGPAYHDEAEGLDGLVHAMDRLGYKPIFIGLPVLIRDGSYRTDYCFIEVGSDGKANTLGFTVVNDIGLIGGTVGSQGGDAFSFGQLADAVFDKMEIS